MASHSQSRPSLRSDRHLPSTKPAGTHGGGGVNQLPVRSKAPATKRSINAGLRASVDDDGADSGRVRVAVRLCPKNAEDLSHESNFVDCVELYPELKRLKLRKNNWISESYRFDEVLSENASQRRVYEVVAKPVVESVLNGYNGTVMAYGQTGTGKTYTIGQLGKDDPSERGIMVRAMEDILSNTSPLMDTVSISYLQLYLESIQDLLAPGKPNISISEDSKSGEVSMTGATIFQIRDIQHFLELLQIGEANRHAANTKLNTESSRSHAILTVHVKRPSRGQEGSDFSSLANTAPADLPTILKSKLVVVDLAGSERIDKSGSEGHMLEEAKFINLSLTCLGKCINALAENSPHIPTRDSKLTRLLRDSFGGHARTSLVITVGPSGINYSETASTIMFGQRAMKVVNSVKLKEEFDYESLCRKLEAQVDFLTSEMERQQKLRDSEKKDMEMRLKECEMSLAEAERHLAMKEKHQLESSAFQNLLADTTQMYEEKVAELIKQLEVEHSHLTNLEEELVSVRQQLTDASNSLEKQDAMDDLNLKLQEMSTKNKEAASVIQSLEAVKDEILSQMRQQEAMDDQNLQSQEMSMKNEESARIIQSLEAAKDEILSEKELLVKELKSSQGKLLEEEKHRKSLEVEIIKLNKLLLDNRVAFEPELSKGRGNVTRPSPGLEFTTNLSKPSKSRESVPGQRATIAKIFEEVGLSKILALLKSEDLDVQTHALKVVANLAAEDFNQQKIVEEGGLDALLLLLESSKNETIQRLTAGAIANLAMNGLNQDLIICKGGARLLASTALLTEDPQTLRMVAGAIANLCGNERLHILLKEDGGINALLAMVRSRHNNVISQVARGVANFAKCESRRINQGRTADMFSWAEFSRALASWFVPPSERRSLQEKYLRLIQGDKTVISYERELTHLSRYAGVMQGDEEDKCNRFIDGLRDSLRQPLMTMVNADYRSLVDTARKLEADQQKVQKRSNFRSKRPQDAPQQQHHQSKGNQGRDWNKKHKSEGRKNEQTGSKGKDYPLCPKCNRHHPGECLQNAGVCYKCQQPGHIARYCQGTPMIQPKFEVGGPSGTFKGKTPLGAEVKPPPGGGPVQARAYALGQREAKEQEDVVTGQWKGRSLLIEDGALDWLVANCTNFADSTRHHIELALCHLAQNEENAVDFIESGGIKELLRISTESSREDICKLAKKALKSNSAFLVELQ